MSSESTHSIKKNADVAAQADHAKSLADPVCGRFGSGWQKAGRHAVAVAGIDQVIHGLQQPRMIELRGNPHRDGEIVVAYPGDIDAGN